ncbi:serine acetyltransferase [Oscillatoriales cyanobacterium LEGE 11467]|uniref:Serine acetyltransferase n=2 Tax=Zarconia TaxID=2992130 RepID=A0A928W0L0_9CYAN|nr:serine acetyltransferase [Zarconia navalis LEGE 11467]
MRSQIPTSTMLATEPDWTREELRRWWDPSRQLLKSIRQYQKGQSRGGAIGATLKAIGLLQYRFWSVVSGAEIPLNWKFSGGLRLLHPNGIIIDPRVSIGPNCMIFQQVTIVGGVKIGARVDIGAGAKIVRPVTIGDGAKIGANAVVLCDVPAGATAVGVPAKILPPKSQRVIDKAPVDRLTVMEKSL